MDSQIIKIAGQIAGIGGLGLGVFLLLFREVVRLKIFPQLGRREAYRIIVLMLVLVWSVAVAGLTAWVWVQHQERQGVLPSKSQEHPSDSARAPQDSAREASSKDSIEEGYQDSRSPASLRQISAPNQTTQLPPPPKQALKKIQATGTGFAPADLPAEQRKYLARRAAEVDARRRLAEIIGTRIQAETESVDLKLQHDKATARVDQWVIAAQVVSERSLTDGGYEVTIEAPLDLK